MDRLCSINREKAFYFFLSLHTFCSLISITMLNQITICEQIFRYIRYFTYIGFTLLCLLSMYNNRPNNLKDFGKRFIEFFSNHYILLSVLTVSSVVLLVSKNRVPLILILVLWGSYSYNFNDIIKLIFKINVTFMVIVVLFQIVGLIPDIIISRGSDLRYSMGYIYPLELMSHFLFIILMYIYIKKSEFVFSNFIYINAINILLFKITDARTSFLLVFIVTLFACLISKYTINFYINKLNIYSVFFVVIAIFLISFLLVSLYSPENELMVFLNRLLSGRLELGHNALMAHGIPLFGEKIEWIGFGSQTDSSAILESYNFVDCSYLKDMFDTGILFLAIALIGYTYIGNYFILNKDSYGLLILLIILILCILEPRLLQIAMNPFIILAGKGLLLDNESIKEGNIV